MPEEVVGAVNTIKLVKEESDTVRDAVLIAMNENNDMAKQLLAANISDIFRSVRKIKNYVQDPEKSVSEGLPVTYIGVRVGELVQPGPDNLERYEREYLPVITVRRDGQFLNREGNEEDPDFLEQKRLLKYLKLRIDDITDTLSEKENEDGENEPNEDLEHLDDVFCVFGIDVYTEVEASLEYMFNHIKELSAIATRDRADYGLWINDLENLVSNPGYAYQDPLALLYPVNTFALYSDKSQYEYKLYFHTAEVYDGDVLGQEEEWVKEIDLQPDLLFQIPPSGGGGGVEYEFVLNQSSLVIRHKDPDTGIVTSAKLFGPIVNKYIHAEGYVKTEEYLSADFIGLDPELDENYGKSGFYLHVDFDLYQDMKFRDKNKMLGDSLMLSLHSLDIIYLKWYETRTFAFVLKAAAIIMIALSLGQAIKAAALTWAFAQSLAIAAAVSAGVSWVVSELIKSGNVALAVAFAVIASLVAYNKGFLNSSVFSLPFANEALFATNAIVSSFTKIQKEEATVLMEEMSAFNSEMEKKNEELYSQISEYRDATGLTDISKETILRISTGVHSNESPNDFFYRTLQMDVNQLSLDAVKEFVPNALVLPELDITSDATLTIV